jgi:hypothetical protein
LQPKTLQKRRHPYGSIPKTGLPILFLKHRANFLLEELDAIVARGWNGCR